MFGIKEESIVVTCDEAKDYIEARISVLQDRRDAVIQELKELDMQISIEMDKLYAVNNPPSKQQAVCRCEVTEVTPENIMQLLSDFKK